jgi:hypothetical protein
MICLKEAGFKISGTKSKSFMKEVKFLGYIISGKNISIDPGKTSVIKQRPPPKDMSDEESISNRIMQLRQLIELDRPKASANIQESKEKQKATQDKANKPT